MALEIAAVSINLGSQSNEQGAGRVTFNPFSTTKKIDQTPPELFGVAAGGAVFTVNCSFYSHVQNPYLSAVFANATLAGVDIRGAAGDDDSGQMKFSFNFQNIAWNYLGI